MQVNVLLRGRTNLPIMAIRRVLMAKEDGEGCTCKVEPVHCLSVYPAEDPDVAGVGHHLNKISHKRGALSQKQLGSIHIDMSKQKSLNNFRLFYILILQIQMRLIGNY